MTPTRLLLGAAAAALLSTAAFAQDAMAPPSAQPEQKAGDNVVNAAPAPAEAMPAPAAASAASMGADASVTASSMDTPAPAAGTVTVSTVTNGPVPDTKENRAKYGSPMSRAGKLTRAAGN